MKNVIICECVLCVSNREPVFVGVINEGDVRVYTPIFVFHHDPCIEIMNRIVCTDTENPIFDCYTRRRYDCRITGKCEITCKLSFGCGHYIRTIRCEIDGRLLQVSVETHHGKMFVHGIRYTGDGNVRSHFDVCSRCKTCNIYYVRYGVSSVHDLLQSLEFCEEVRWDDLFHIIIRIIRVYIIWCSRDNWGIGNIIRATHTSDEYDTL